MTDSEKLEYQMRGEVISASAKIESSIISLILVANLGDPKQQIIAFKDGMIKYKMTIAKELLQKFHSAENIKKGNNIIRRFKEIQTFRNRFAHCRFYWDDYTHKTFKVWDIREDKIDGDYMYTYMYTMNEYNMRLKSLHKISEDLEELIIKIHNDLGSPLNILLKSLAKPIPQKQSAKK